MMTSGAPGGVSSSASMSKLGALLTVQFGSLSNFMTEPDTVWFADFRRDSLVR